MKDTLLFSDVHLKPCVSDPSGQKDFIAFLGQIDPDRVERLICVGDLFDFWYEYKHAVFASYFEALRLFSNLRDAGVEMHLFKGNHDLWAGPQLERLTGMQIHDGAATLPFGPQKALLLHGDGLNPEDRAYLLFKRCARNRLLQNLFRHIHPDSAMSLAEWISGRSRAKADGANPDQGPEAEIVRNHARRIIGEGQAEIVICGHAHSPAIERIEENGHAGLYVNPGDWPMHRSYIRYNEEFSLHTFC